MTSTFPRWILTGLLAMAPGAARAQVVIGPGGAPSTAVIESAEGGTTVRLTGPSRLEWQQFRVGAGQQLNYVSEGGGGHATLNVVRSAAPAAIHGSITADGPFHLISPSGIQVGRTGHISAPRVLLSALGTDQDTALLTGGAAVFTKRGNGLVTIDGLVAAGNGGSVVVLGSTARIGAEARLTAPGGLVQVVAADANAVTGSAAGVSFGTAPVPGRGLVNQEGTLSGRQVHVLSDGFLRNGGRLLASGVDNEVRLSAPQVTHELRPDNRSVISTGRLVVQGNFRQDGPVVNPDDGANPAPAAGIRQTPRLASRGFLTTVTPGQTQLSASPLQAVLPAVSPIPADRRKPALVAARGTEAAGAAPDEKKKVKPPAGPAPAPPAGSVRKAAFFGSAVSR